MDLIKKCFVIGSDGDFTYKTLYFWGGISNQFSYCLPEIS